MIVGIGVDIVEVKRIDKLLAEHPDRFLNKLFTPAEVAYAQSQPQSAQALAHRFAAKEALVKALGTGFQEQIRFQDIEVVKTARGQPQIQLHGQAKHILEQLIEPHHICRIHCSLSHTTEHAVAMVVIEKDAV